MVLGQPRRTDEGAAGPPIGKNICVFLGGNLGCRHRFLDEAAALGRRMAVEGVGLVYGGARCGLMGILADAVLEAGGFVTGVVPRQLSYQELAHEKPSRLYEVNTMHERKHKLQVLSQGFIALPGGYGTLEEITEVLCWAQQPLEMHEKPCVFANIDGYYDYLFRFLDHAVEQGLLLPPNRALARQEPGAVEALQAIQAAWAQEEQAIWDVIRRYEN